MSLERYADAASDTHIFLEQATDERLPAIQERALELYNDVDERNLNVFEYFLRTGYKADIESNMDHDIAFVKWESIGDLVDMPLDELAAVPKNKRGDDVNDAMAIILEASQMQARYETGLELEATQQGVKIGEFAKKELKGLKRENGKNINSDIKNIVKRKKKEAENG